MKRIVLILLFTTGAFLFPASKAFTDYKTATSYLNKEVVFRAMGIDNEDFYKELQVLFVKEYYTPEVMSELEQSMMKNGFSEKDFKNLHKLYTEGFGKRFLISVYLVEYGGFKYVLPENNSKDMDKFTNNPLKQKEVMYLSNNSENISKILEKNSENVNIFSEKEEALFLKYYNPEKAHDFNSAGFEYTEKYRVANNFFNAMTAKSSEQEREYLTLFYPGSLDFISQRIVQNDGKSFDVIRVMDNRYNKEMDYYFDISAYFD